MTDNELGRAFTTMIILLIVLTFGLAFMGIFMAKDVDAKLDEERDVGEQQVISNRISPIGEITVGDIPIASSGNEAELIAGDEVYNTACATCHGPGLAGAPKTDDSAAWSTRLAQGIQTIYDHAINGFTGNAGVMPAKGGNPAYSDASIKAAVDYMLEQSK